MVDGFFVFVGIYFFCYAVSYVAVSSRVASTSLEARIVILTMLASSIMTVVVEDVLLFYVIFEVMLLVMVMAIAGYWYMQRTSYAVYMLIVYTLLGSSMLAMGLTIHYVLIGSYGCTHGMEAYQYSTYGSIAGIMLHVGFYSKIPSYPLHHWLTEAHTESTTEGSIILAGVYLKVGVLGWYRYALHGCTPLVAYSTPIWVVCCIAGSCSVSVLVLSTLDLKRFAAASSILHLQVVLLCMVVVDAALLTVGSSLQLLVHSWIAVLLFYWIGESYEIQGSRLSKGHVHTGRSTTIMLVLVLANSGFPISVSYTAEWLMLTALMVSGHVLVSIAACIVAGILAVSGAMLWISLSMGRSRIHAGVHTTSQGRSLYILPMLVVLWISTIPSSYGWSILSIVGW